tara:strand:- start:53 stop:388 length:336 start_codon:yes stop_codon:yes gene_type:complete
MKTSMNDYLEQDGSIAFSVAIFNRMGAETGSGYMELGFIEGVYQWATHNIMSVDECKNEKYTGWTISFKVRGGQEYSRKFYIENWVMSITPKGWSHAKNMFNKYLQTKTAD